MTGASRLPICVGIAIGPILFVIAIIALLAAAIAAGSGAFTGGTSGESAKLMATAILEQACNVDNSVNLLRGQGFTDQALYFGVPDNMFTSAGYDLGQSFSGFPAPSGCTSPTVLNPDTCSVYKPLGGGATPQAIPQAAIDQTLLDSVYAGSGVCGLGDTLGCRAPVVTLVQLQLNPPMNLAYGYFMVPLTKDVCMKINDLVGVSNPIQGGSPAPPQDLSYNYAGGGDINNDWEGYSTYYSGANIYIGDSFMSGKDFCFYGYDGFLATNAYMYMHILK